MPHIRNAAKRVFRPPVRLWYRMRASAPYVRHPLSSWLRWLYNSRESTNFTYALSDRNVRYLATFIAHCTGARRADAERYIHEVQDDRELADHVRSVTAEKDATGSSDGSFLPGRRSGWYAITRILKPRLVIETGIDKGLGACILCAALRRNAAEGHPGRYLGTDIDPNAGWLLRPPYDEVGEIMYGDSIESLRRIEKPVDLFINDSDHSADYERREYLTIAPRLSERSMIIGDNSRVTTELHDFAVERDWRFLLFFEEPDKHWYQGAGLGVAWRAANG